MEQVKIRFNGHNFKVLLRDEADKSVLSEIFKYREYKAAENIIKSAKLPILDIGAHAGFFTLYCRALNAVVPIIAVEPEKNNLQQLQKHLKLNNIIGVKIAKEALGGETGERELIVSSDSHNHKLGPVADKTFLKTVKLVNARSFKDFLKTYKIAQVSLIKMDIEGGEYEALFGMEEKNFGAINSIILEYHDGDGRTYQELERRLRQNGFGVQRFPSKFDKSLGFIWATNKSQKYKI